MRPLAASALLLLHLGTYLLLGLAGLPVFSAASGPAAIATPSFGYLLAFPFEAAAVSVALSRLGNRKGKRYWAALVGVAVSYLVALPYVAVLKGVYLNAPVPLEVLLSAYCLAFLPLDLGQGRACSGAGQAGWSGPTFLTGQAFFSRAFPLC